MDTPLQVIGQLLGLLVVLVGMLFLHWATTDAWKRPQNRFPEGQSRAFWLLLMMLTGIPLGFIPVIFYYRVVYRTMGPRDAVPADEDVSASA